MQRFRKDVKVALSAVLALLICTFCSGCSLGSALKDGAFLGLSEIVSQFVQGLAG
jgi:hypothetical protein